MRFSSLLFTACLVAGAQFTRTAFFHNQQVLTCQTDSNATDLSAYDVWAERPGELDIQVASSEASRLKALFGGRCQVAIEDLEAVINEHHSTVNSLNATEDWFSNYRSYQDLVDWYNRLAAEYPQIVRIGTIGQSLEGRNQPFVSIEGNTGGGVKPVVYFQCLIHAREWISGATCNYVVNHLVTNYNVDPVITTILNSLRVVVVPFVNPDGYAFTWTNNRLWRKNRVQNQGSSCLGVDLNRNFDDRWGGAGSSADPCSETFRGRAANSEVETQNIASFFRQLAAAGPVHAAVDWHSYSQLLLRPYTWQSVNAPHEAQMRAITDRMRDIIRDTSGRAYTSDKWFSGLYVSTGVSQDWFYNLPQSRVRAGGFTFELRPRTAGEGGFILPPEQIIPTGQEMVAATRHFLTSFITGLPTTEEAATV